jgi:general secretion pathway protein K
MGMVGHRKAPATGLIVRRVRRQRGFALLLVLWSLILLGLVAASFLRETRVDTTLARYAAENAKAEALADAGVQRAILGLLDPEPATAWRADGRLYRFALGEGEVSIQVQDEGGKIDLNYAPAAVLMSLFEAAGTDSETARRLADAVQDYVDGDHERRPAGAEDPDYLAANRNTGAKDAPLDRKEELVNVLGMTRLLYQAVAPYVTVYSGHSDINVMTAPDIVLRLIPDLTPQQRDQIMSARSGAVTGDIPRIEAATIHAEATTRAGGRFIREAVIRASDTTDGPFEMLDWQHIWPAPSR